MVCKVGGEQGRMKPLTLEELSTSGTEGGREGEGELNEKFLAVIYSVKMGLSS